MRQWQHPSIESELVAAQPQLQSEKEKVCEIEHGWAWAWPNVSLRTHPSRIVFHETPPYLPTDT